jgi:hypothetical protein
MIQVYLKRKALYHSMDGITIMTLQMTTAMFIFNRVLCIIKKAFRNGRLLQYVFVRLPYGLRIITLITETINKFNLFIVVQTYRMF